jgi:maltose O-acetyltransferase
MQNLNQALRFIPYAAYKLIKKWHEEYRYETYRRNYEISRTFRFNGYDILLYGKGRIQLGENSYIVRSSSIQAEEEFLVQIGQYCAISHNVRIYTTTNVVDQDFCGQRIHRSADVIIEDGVWIGANVFINPGIRIGTNSIVGANSVVTHDVPAWSVVGGVPAHLIRMKAVINALIT